MSKKAWHDETPPSPTDEDRRVMARKAAYAEIRQLNEYLDRIPESDVFSRLMVFGKIKRLYRAMDAAGSHPPSVCPHTQGEHGMTEAESALRDLASAVRRLNRHLLKPDNAGEARDVYYRLAAALAQADDVLDDMEGEDDLEPFVYLPPEEMAKWQARKTEWLVAALNDVAARWPVSMQADDTPIAPIPAPPEASSA